MAPKPKYMTQSDIIKGWLIWYDYVFQHNIDIDLHANPLDYVFKHNQSVSDNELREEMSKYTNIDVIKQRVLNHKYPFEHYVSDLNTQTSHKHNQTVKYYLNVIRGYGLQNAIDAHEFATLYKRIYLEASTMNECLSKLHNSLTETEIH